MMIRVTIFSEKKSSNNNTRVQARKKMFILSYYFMLFWTEKALSETTRMEWNEKIHLEKIVKLSTCELSHT